MHTSSRCLTHGGCLTHGALVRRHAGGGLPQTNYCQASARRDMIMGARMCAQGTPGLLRDAWLGSASACECSVLFWCK